MNAWKIVRPGWVEGGIGALWFVATAVGFASTPTRVPVAAVSWDFIALCALLVTLRWTQWGLPLVAVVAVAGLLVDVGGVGVSPYICACAVTVGVRKGKFWRAALPSLAIAFSMVTLMIRRHESEIEWGGVIVGPLLVLGLAWLVGLGFFWVGRLEAVRVSKAYLDRQLRIALDIHDFVGRNLAGVLMMAKGASPQQRSDPAFLDELLRRVRTADSALRDVTVDLQREGGNQRIRHQGAVDALEAGLAELTTAGFSVQREPGLELLPVGLPSDLDLVVGRIIAEALHNVAKHGDKARPCRFGASQQAGALRIEVVNGVTGRRARAPQSLGLVGMARHAKLAGGTVDSGTDGDTWTCRVMIPLFQFEGV